MKEVIDAQDKIFKKIKKIFSNSNIIHNNLFLCAFNFSIGYGFLKYFVNKKNVFLIIKFFFIEIINIFLSMIIKLKK